MPALRRNRPDTLWGISEEVTVSENHCPSCSSLTGRETSCKTVERAGEVSEAIPESLIRKAALKLFGLE